jgi:hypothetical protein
MKEWLGKNKFGLILILAAFVLGFFFGRKPSFEVYPTPVSVVPDAFTGEKTLPVEGGRPTEDKAVEPSSLSERLVIKTANLSLLVKDVRESASKMQKLAEDVGGFVVDSNISVVDQKKETLSAWVTIRVPVEKFDEALARLKESAVKVSSEQISGEDVTEQYTDLQSRLRNLEAAEAQLLKIMERAGEIKDVLAVQQELTQVREQIETTRGRIKFLEESAKMSKITAYFATEEGELPIVEERWSPLKTVKEGLRALASFWQAVADRLIFWGVFLSPILVLLAAAWVWKKTKGRQEGR